MATLERVYTLEGMREIYPRLRPLDRLELEVMGEAAFADFLKGEVWMGRVEGQPACLFGVGREGLLDPAIIWMLSTDLIVKHKVAFIKMSTPFVMDALERHGVLMTTCLAANKASQRWLTWLGFTLKGQDDYPELGSIMLFERSL